MKQVINLTPHEITVVGHYSLSPSGEVARVTTEEVVFSSVNGLPIGYQVTGEVTGLPEPTEGTVYIVSTMVRLALPRRFDIYSPGQLVRDDLGKPIGCQMLIRNE